MTTLFIANRGEIALRIIRGAHAAGFECAVGRPAVDEAMPYVDAADTVVNLESPRSFSEPETMVRAAREAGAHLLHPGYGFLSESAEFARGVEAAGITFVGPPADVIELMGGKANARMRAHAAGLATPRGSLGPVRSAEEAHAIAEEVGFPLMVKAVAGGGGIGMAIARDSEGLDAVLASVSQRASSVFADGRVIVEQYIERSRHIEVQVMGLPDGTVVAMGERDCSVQRRHQKVIEESPSPAVGPDQSRRLRESARRLAAEVGYRNAGTVEFILDLDTDEVFFLEMNTRLQVEHPITESVHAVDLVRWQLAVSQGLSEIPAGFQVDPQGHAFELRVYAEDPVRFLPRPGVVRAWRMPEGEGVRVDAGYGPGTTVTPFFDPLLAKIVVSGATRDEALRRARKAVACTVVEGPASNLEFLARALADPDFTSGNYDTSLVDRVLARANR